MICSIFIAILFPIFIVIGLLTDFLFSILIYFLIVLTPVGIIGGIWLWEYLGSSDLFQDKFTIFPKIIGIIGIIGLGFFTFMSFSIALGNDIILINQIVEMGTILLFFMCWYFIGYLISIWNPKEISSTEKIQGFKIKWKLVVVVFGILGLYSLIIFGIFYFIFLNGILTWDEFNFYLMNFLMAGVGIALGWIFWEHLGELDLIKGDFQRVLKIISIISFSPLIILLILGFFTLNTWNFHLKKIIILGYSLFIYLMLTYFLGLGISVFRK